MRPKHVIESLEYCFKAKHPIMLTGRPGVGKTAMVEQTTKKLGYNLIYTDIATSDNTRAEGMPWINPKDEEAKFFPFGDLAAALKAKTDTTWFFDNLGWGAISVQNSFRYLIHERRTPAGRKLPDCVNIVAATNRRTDKAGVQGLSEAVKSGFVTMIEVDPNKDDLVQHAIATDWQPEMIAWMQFQDPEKLFEWTPTADLVNAPCPRTLHNADKILKMGTPLHIEFPMLSGAIGQGHAAVLSGFLKMFRELPVLDGILLDPVTAKIPTEPSIIYAVCIGLASKVANEATFGKVYTYAERLRKGGNGEYAILLVRDIIRRKPELQATHTFISVIAPSELGKMWQGGED